VRKCPSGVAIGGRGEAKTLFFQAIAGVCGVDTRPPPDRASRFVRVREESHKKEGVEQERVPGLGRSPFGSFGSLISEILKMSHGLCNSPDAVNNVVQVRAAAGSHHVPIPWPWPNRWA